MIESGLSPPYDGSEFQELFPELTGVEPEEMVDIESLADRALMSVDVAVVDNPSVMMSDKASICSLETNSDNGSVYEHECEVPDKEAEEDDPDQLLRYLVGSTSRKSRRLQSKSSNDSGRFSDSSQSHDQVQATASLLSQSQSLTSRRYTKRKEPQIAKPAKSFTVVDEQGACKSVEGPNRNAVMAKLNRERKKQLMSELEEKVGLLDTENEALKKQNVRLRKKANVLTRELQYVKGILANQSTLSSLLKNIKATGLEFHTSMPVSQPSSASGANKRKRQSDHDYCLEESEELNSKKVAKSSESESKVKGDMTEEYVLNTSEEEAAGVCLHVSGDTVSLEFCSKCSEKAKLAGTRSESA